MCGELVLTNKVSEIVSRDCIHITDHILIGFIKIIAHGIWKFYVNNQRGLAIELIWLNFNNGQFNKIIYDIHYLLFED